MRFMHDLRKMIFGILCTVQSLCWAMVLLGMVMFIFAVLLMEFVNGAELDPDSPLISMYYSLPFTIFQLFGAICGGLDWLDLVMPFFELSWIYGILFMMYISFSVFCVLNIVTA